jgi:hypothetical protein
MCVPSRRCCGLGPVLSAQQKTQKAARFRLENRSSSV